ncbi:efflux RND transporter permease subunit [Exilibacterium tricleocarpae]|uniref:Efflux RND transporter permease subunit n=1 Tax=Exilibacterium tricleocarpae TaxID=2591008 RepID=A0A545TSE3_9GAMM|nr:efflux RND transporter permease subunit [Exilibacterium tricleocarpae]TQV80140.1 efflux RND transporter permease subunit [Exilibacterium tricleocarpae]
MRFLDSAVSRFRSTFCVLMLIVFAGMYVRGNMTIESFPQVSVPIVVVQVYYDGASPEDGARLLVRPLETELRSIEGIDEITATARESTVYMVVEFDSGFDIDQALVDVREAVDRAKAEFPEDAEEPVVEEISAQDFPAIVVTLAGAEVQERVRFQTAQTLKRRIEAIPSVLAANMVGHREEVVEALIDPAQLEHYNITSDELVTAVLGNNLLVPAGELDTGEGRFAVKVPGLIETRADVYGLPVKSTTDGVITLGEVADIRRTFKDPTRHTSVNGEPAITIEVEKRTGANQIQLSEAVRAVVEAARDEFPQGLDVGYVLDSSAFSQNMVSEMEGNIVTAMALVMIIVVAALGFRSGLLVGFGIPFSLLFATIVVYFVGFSFNFMVMFGMLLALGMLIDGAIVITEFADRKMAEGMSSRAAYQIAVKRMFWPVVASTATTLAAFLPLLFWPGVPGEFMRFLPVTVFAVLIGSLLYALLFAPAIGSKLGRAKLDTETQRQLKHLETSAAVDMPGVTGTYARALRFVLQRPGVMLLFTLATLFSIFTLYGKYNVGVEFFTETEEKYGYAAVRAQGNLSVEESRRIVREVENRVLQTPGVNVTYTASGSSGGAQGGNRGSTKDQIGTILVELDDPENLPRSTHAVFEEIRQRTADMPGIFVEARTFESGPPVGKPVQLQLESNHPDKLLEVTRFLRDHLAANVDGLRDVTDSSPLPGIEWEMTVDRSRAAQMGANVVEVGRAVQLLTNGVKVGEYRPDDADDEVEIRVRYPTRERGISALDSLRVNTAGGPVPISSFVSRNPRPKVDKVERIDGVQVMKVSADVEEGVLADDKVKEIQAWLDENPVDPQVSVVFRGSNEEQAESQAFLSVAFSLALFLMFVLLVTQFNSFYQGVLILSSVIMSTAGVMLGLLITQSTFSTILTGVGIVALAGIVVNNNIVLIDTYNHVRRLHREMSAAEAVIMASAQRLRPVFLTTVTTILGLLPIATNVSVDLMARDVVVGGVIASFWVPLASAIVYGLAFSTVLTLVITPVCLVLPSRIATLCRPHVLRLRDSVQQRIPLSRSS